MSLLDNARQVITDGHVCGVEDGGLTYLFWVHTGEEITEPMAAEILKLLGDEEAFFSAVEIFAGLMLIGLAETFEPMLADCGC